MIIEKILSLNINFLQSWGYVILFLGTFLESIPVFGLFVPGALITFICAFIARLGFMNLYLIMGIAIGGAILGDLFGYLLGRYLGKDILHKYGKFFLLKKEYLERAGEILCNHAGKSLVIGRLNPVTRPAAPFIVGAHKYNFFKFMIYNILGAVMWGVIFGGLGYLLGRNYAFAQKLEKNLLIGTVAVLLGLYLLYFIKVLVDKRKSYKIAQMSKCIEKWA